MTSGLVTLNALDRIRVHARWALLKYIFILNSQDRLVWVHNLLSFITNTCRIRLFLFTSVLPFTHSQSNMATADPNPRPKWDVHNPHSMAGQRIVTTMRKIYNPIGFKKGYNFPLFIIGVGGLMGFTLSRMYYWDFDGRFARVSTLYVSTSPGASMLTSSLGYHTWRVVLLPDW
ncbi:hypothetical protein ES702_00407 [subsurface metagenome]